MPSSKCGALNRARAGKEPDLALYRCHWEPVFCSQGGLLSGRAGPQETEHSICIAKRSLSTFLSAVMFGSLPAYRLSLGHKLASHQHMRVTGP